MDSLPFEFEAKICELGTISHIYSGLIFVCSNMTNITFLYDSYSFDVEPNSICTISTSSTTNLLSFALRSTLQCSYEIEPIDAQQSEELSKILSSHCCISIPDEDEMFAQLKEFVCVCNSTPNESQQNFLKGSTPNFNDSQTTSVSQALPWFRSDGTPLEMFGDIVTKTAEVVSEGIKTGALIAATGVEKGAHFFVPLNSMDEEGNIYLPSGEKREELKDSAGLKALHAATTVTTKVIAPVMKTVAGVAKDATGFVERVASDKILTPAIESTISSVKTPKSAEEENENSLSKDLVNGALYVVGTGLKAVGTVTDTFGDSCRSLIGSSCESVSHAIGRRYGDEAETLAMENSQAIVSVVDDGLNIAKATSVSRVAKKVAVRTATNIANESVEGKENEKEKENENENENEKKEE